MYGSPLLLAHKAEGESAVLVLFLQYNTTECLFGVLDWKEVGGSVQGSGLAGAELGSFGG